MSIRFLADKRAKRALSARCRARAARREATRAGNRRKGAAVQWSLSASALSATVGSLAIVVLLSAVLVAGLNPAAAHDTPGDTDTMITVDGGGWGHGVGMSQYGAYGRADAGQSHEEILEFYYQGANLKTADVPDDVRVHIHSGAGTKVTPPPGGGPENDIQIVDASGQLIFNHDNGKPLTIRRVAGGFTVIRPSGRNLCLDDAGVDLCKGKEISVRFMQGEPITVDVFGDIIFNQGTTGNRYRWGELVISRRPAAPTSTLYVVLEGLTMDQYLYGLAEVPASWPAQVLQTQAVAGRTYAFDRATSRRASSTWPYPWDLYSTVSDQVYHGYEKEIGTYGPVWTAAVDATSREVMLHSGKPITAFYSSSNGGWTEDSGYVFVTSLPYLVPQRDTFDSFRNPYATWSRDYTGTEVGTWLANAKLGSVGHATDVTISGNIGASGRVDRATVTVTGTTSTLQISGNSFRNAINSGVRDQGGGLSRQILSTKYTVSVVGGEEPIGAVDKVTRKNGVVSITGWVFDADTGSSVSVEIHVDDVVVATTAADQTRFDVDAVFNEGQQRGFEAEIQVPDGAHWVCVYGDNVGPGEQLLLGCKLVT